MDVLEEEALAPEDSLTRLYILEEARGLDQDIKHYGRYSNEQVYRLKYIHSLYSDKQRHGVCSKNPYSPS